MKVVKARKRSKPLGLRAPIRNAASLFGVSSIAEQGEHSGSTFGHAGSDHRGRAVETQILRFPGCIPDDAGYFAGAHVDVVAGIKFELKGELLTEIAFDSQVRHGDGGRPVALSIFDRL